jgi:hypothetical protein
MGNNQIDFLNMYQDPRLINAIQSWNLFSFLDDHNVSYIMEGKNIGNNFIGVAPCPGCGDSRFHFGIHKDKKFGSCFICKCYLSPLKLVSYYGRMSYSNAFDYFIKYSEYEKDVEQRVLEIIRGNNVYIEKEYVPDPTDPLPHGTVDININMIRRNSLLRDFLNRRKLNLWHVKRYDLKLLRNEIVWPIYLRNKVVSYQKRHLVYKRYHTPTNLQHYIYNEDQIIPNKPLIIVEGFLDYTRVDSFVRCYYKNKASVTTGMLKSVSNRQIDRIIKCNPYSLIVIFDNDSWFDYWRLKKIMPFDVDFVILPKGTDPNELTWTQLKDVFNQIKIG